MKFVCRIEKDRIKIIKMRKGPRQMISISSRLYVVTDNLALKDLRTDDAMYIYGIDDTQPYGVRPTIVDPDRTRALIRSAQLSGTKKKVWANITPNKAMDWIVPVAIIGALAWGFLSAGGL